MKRLSLIDDMFLRVESRRQPLHIGTLMLFELPQNAPKDFTAKLAERLRQSTHAASPFNWRLVRRRGLHYWTEDEHFDLGQHFVHTCLPSPGRIRELLSLISRVHSGHLDREYPLWRMYLIEGIEGGRIALYLKIHHAVTDGVAGMRMVSEMMAGSAEESVKLPPPWEISRRKSNAQPLPVPTPAAGILPALQAVAREGLASVSPLLRELRGTLQDARAAHPHLVLAGQAPRTVFNQKVSATRRFAAQSYATSRIRAVANALGASLNDVILAMCGGALRSYLKAAGSLPRQSLVAAVPVSIRRGGGGLGNKVSFTMTTLATDLDDPARRLCVIKECMDYNKQRMRELEATQVQAYAALVLLPGAIKAMLGLNPEMALASVVISHVPGPRQDMYWQGARLTGLYPVSLVTDSGALNITVVSRHDFVDFGLIACRKSVPHMQRLLEDLESALKELEACV
ncbi:MAG: wax ester/triacylglycerol synthase family O-acyltransferase [Nevskia sp.]|nr:wax ester/triacylglycerol synthase family O-acyltransferase [Nevskia sp.]